MVLPMEPLACLGERPSNLKNKLRRLFDAQTPRFDTDPIETIHRIRVRRNAALNTVSSTTWNQTHWLIQIKGNEPTTRQRFTLLRELKHIIDAPALSTTYATIRSRIDHSHHQVEYLCDHFAAHVLMPRNIVNNIWDEGNHDIRTLAKTFGVSTSDMRRQPQRLGLINNETRFTQPTRLHGLTRQAEPNRPHLISQPQNTDDQRIAS